ncbi:hypothetical protein [Nostoc sp.]|uniref:hypothetical protein n=1 Tax=Nostoc sp. TaxID=1180 RepID=UPI002FF7BF02
MAERRKLTTNPLTSTEGVALQVDDVYVPLGLIERKKQSKVKNNVSSEQGSELYKETEITKTFYSRLDDDYYDLAWKCAQNMPYPDFYQAWHQHNVATRAMQSLKKILFTRII